MSASSPSEPASEDHHHGSGLDNVRAAAAEVHRRVVQWREAPQWRDDETNRDRYAVTVRAAAALDELPETASPMDVIQAVRPITETWRPNRAGPEQAIYAAVDRLREAIQRAG